MGRQGAHLNEFRGGKEGKQIHRLRGHFRGLRKGEDMENMLGNRMSGEN